MAKKQEIDQQLTDAIAVAQRLGANNRQLQVEIDRLTAENTQLRTDFDSAVERVRYLAGQVDLLELQIQSKTQYSDSDKNY